MHVKSSASLQETYLPSSFSTPSPLSHNTYTNDRHLENSDHQSLDLNPIATLAFAALVTSNYDSNVDNSYSNCKNNKEIDIPIPNVTSTVYYNCIDAEKAIDDSMIKSTCLSPLSALHYAAKLDESYMSVPYYIDNMKYCMPLKMSLNEIDSDTSRSNNMRALKAKILKRLGIERNGKECEQRNAVNTLVMRENNIFENGSLVVENCSVAASERPYEMDDSSFVFVDESNGKTDTNTVKLVLRRRIIERALQRESYPSTVQDENFLHNLTPCPYFSEANHEMSLDQNNVLPEEAEEHSFNNDDAESKSDTTKEEKNAKMSQDIILDCIEYNDVHNDNKRKKRPRWSENEHRLFLEGMRKYGRKWEKIQKHVGTKSQSQVRTHGYGYFAKLTKIDEDSFEVAKFLATLSNQSHAV